MVILENEQLKALIDPKGAELQSFYNKQTGLEYMWNGDQAFWPRHSPVLFPIVGGLIEDSYLYKGKKYKLAKHGFARDMDFEIENSSSQSTSMVLRSTDETLKDYPFDFLLRITYKLDGNKIAISYEIENPSENTIYFSIGSHPAFNLPVVAGTSYEDYYLEFNQEENSVRHTLDGNILIAEVPYLENQTKLKLNPGLFYDDAVIFKDLKSTTISIKSDKTPHGLHYNFEGFPYMGIWAAKDAPFICIEPWCGLPDSKNHNQNIEEKEGIVALEKGKNWEKSWSLEGF